MKTAIIYQSHYGYAKQYAQWIAQSLNAPLFEASQIFLPQISEYDQIIFGGALYAGSVSGIQLITKNPALFSGKKMIVFIVGMGPHPEEKFAGILTHNNIPKAALCFYLRGGMDISKLNFLHKWMINTLRFVLKMKGGEKSKLILEAFKTPQNFISKEALVSRSTINKTKT